MTTSKEIRVGVIGLIVLFTTLFTFNYLNRQNTFSTNLIITAKFKDIEFLKKGNPVLIKGREYGHVANIYKEGDDLFVEMDIESGTMIPSSAKASITEMSLLGGRVVALIYSGSCAGDCLKSGAVIPGEVNNLASQVETFAEPILKQFGKIADTLLGPNGIETMLNKAHASAAGLAKTTKSFEGKMRGMSKTLPGTIKSFRDLTDQLANAEAAQLKDMAAGSVGDAETQMALDSLIQSLASMSNEDIEAMTKILYTAGEYMDKKVPPMIEKGKTALKKADASVDGLTKKMKAFEEGAEGTIPKLLYDGPYKDSLNLKIQKLSEKLRDIREYPEKYLKL